MYDYKPITITALAALLFVLALTSNSALASESGDISAAVDHSCARVSDGTVRCWGYNEYGQLGNGTILSSNTPVAVSGLTNVVEIAGGGLHQCALLTNGTVRCWGANFGGALGDGTSISRSTGSSGHVPNFVPSEDPFRRPFLFASIC